MPVSIRRIKNHRSIEISQSYPYSSYCHAQREDNRHGEINCVNYFNYRLIEVEDYSFKLNVRCEEKYDRDDGQYL